MGKITVWTKQHENMLKILESEGRYTAKREYIKMDLEEHADLVLEVYEWLVKNGPDAANRPADVEFPVWVSFEKDATMMSGEGTVILELELEEEWVTHVNIAKWGTILNYGYIPADESDAARHKQLLCDYGISDAKAYMSQFYPQIKMEIRDSWKRLFDPSILMGNKSDYGNIWEVRQEWIKRIIR